jgi:hypothetical protein
MNDFDPTLDEIVSAYVDGEATAAERARVEADPALLERVATFRRLHQTVAATTEPASAEAQRTMIARALRETTVPVPTVDSLRARRLAAAARPLAIAAAVIAAFIGFGALVATSDRGDDAGTASSGASATIKSDTFSAQGAGAGAADSAAEAAQAPTAAGATTPLAAVSAPPFIGAFADEASLRQVLSTGVAKAVPQADASSRNTTTTTCPDVTTATAAGATIYRAELRTRVVTIAVTGTRADVIDDLTCTRTSLDLTSR